MLNFLSRFLHPRRKSRGVTSHGRGVFIVSLLKMPPHRSCWFYLLELCTFCLREGLWWQWICKDLRICIETLVCLSDKTWLVLSFLGQTAIFSFLFWCFNCHFFSMPKFFLTCWSFGRMKMMSFGFGITSINVSTRIAWCARKTVSGLSSELTL